MAAWVDGESAALTESAVAGPRACAHPGYRSGYPWSAAGRAPPGKDPDAARPPADPALGDRPDRDRRHHSHVRLHHRAERGRRPEGPGQPRLGPLEGAVTESGRFPGPHP